MGVPIIYNILSGRVPDIWAGDVVCPGCGNRGSSFYCRNRSSIRLFWVIPVFSITKSHVVYCGRCGNVQKLSYLEYHRKCHEQVNKMMKGEYPLAILQMECEPSNLKYGKKLFYFILAVLWACLILSTILDAYERSGAIFVAIIGLIPLYRSGEDFILAYKKKSALKKRQSRKY